MLIGELHSPHAGGLIHVYKSIVWTKEPKPCKMAILQVVIATTEKAPALRHNTGLNVSESQ